MILQLEDAMEVCSSSSSSGRRPMNAFLLFCKRHRGIVKEKYPSLENRSITKILGEWWQSLSDNDKASFNSLAAEYKEHVMREQPNFRWRKPPVVNGAHNNGEKAAPVTDSRSGSNSSSPEPSPSPSGPPVSAAPKPFKKRFLAAEKAKEMTGVDLGNRMSPDDAHACKALLQLAGVRESSPIVEPENGSSRESRSGTNSPPLPKQKPENGFTSLRDAVWNKVAKTLLKQEEEKGQPQEDAPLNLSSQCSIRGQTIIEHIIENILDKGGENAVQDDALSNLNNNGQRLNGSSGGGDDPRDTDEDIKDKIYKSLKQDKLNRGFDNRDHSALWSIQPHTNLNGEKRPTPPSTSPKEKTPTPEQRSPSVAKQLSPPIPSPPIPPPPPPSREDSEQGLYDDDASKVDIKSLLAQSPVPNSTRSLDRCPSLANAVIASVLQEQKLDRKSRLTFVVSKKPESPELACKTNDTDGAQSNSATKRKADDEEDIRRSSRSCKGRRYQEFKDEGIIGKNRSGSAGSGRRTHRSGDSVDSSCSDDVVMLTKVSPTLQNSNGQKKSDSKTNGIGTNTQSPSGTPSSFDVAARLNAIPALSLDDYQQKFVKPKTTSTTSSSSKSSSSSETCSSDQLRRKSTENSGENENVAKRKIRRTTAKTKKEDMMDLDS